MSQRMGWQQRLFIFMAWLKGFRYIKFGLVGASGTVVNLVVLYTAHKYLFNAIESSNGKPYASLALAIAVATANNFTWNRLWTWSDRLRAAAAQARPGQAAQTGLSVLLGQFGRYAFASWIGIALQYGLTLWLTDVVRQFGPTLAWPDARRLILANVIAIVIASFINFLTNDRWTFRHRPSH